MIKRGAYILKNRVSAEALQVSKEIKRHVTTAILAALGFIIALVWRDIIQITFTSIVKSLGLGVDTYLSSLFSVVLITIFCVLGIIYLSRWAER